MKAGLCSRNNKNSIFFGGGGGTGAEDEARVEEGDEDDAGDEARDEAGEYVLPLIKSLEDQKGISRIGNRASMRPALYFILGCCLSTLTS